MKLNRFRQNRLAMQTALFLLLSFAAIHGASLYVYNTYDRLTGSYLTGPRLAREVMRLINLSKELSLSDFQIVMRHTHYTGINIQIADRSSSQIQAIGNINLDQIQQNILANPKNFHFDIPLTKKQWLIISTHIQESKWLQLQFVLALLVLFAALIILIYWLVNSFIMPLEDFAKAVQRYDQDPNAPPIAETGPAPIRMAIHSFNVMQSKLQQFVTGRTQMLAAISHDLRTPLTRLKLRVEDLSDPIKAEKMNRDIIEMEQMINSILTFVRSDVSDEAVEAFDLNALLETICDDMIDAGHSVILHQAKNRIVVQGRMNALKRVFNNVIDNAIKYGESAEVFLNQTNGNAQIKICDQGPGIPSNQLEKVFLPFYRVNTARTPTTIGSGLGLAVAQEIIHLHKGHIRLRNRREKGLAVIIDLPIQNHD